MAGSTKKTPKKPKIKQKQSPKAIKHRMNYSNELMQNAVTAVKSGMSCSEASRKYKVPRITLLYKVQGKFKDKKCGRESYLNHEEEKLLVDWIVTMGKAGFPVTKIELLDSVQRLVKDLKVKYPEREFPFVGNRPGRHWYESFLKRNPQISVRTAQNLTSSRSNVSEQQLRQWHAEITSYLEANNLSCIVENPKRVFNADEAAFFLNPKGNKVLTSRGEKCVYSIVNNDEKECLTVMISGNAFGDVCPSMIVFQYERIPQDIVENIPSDWGVGRSENGWMTTGIFYEFISNIFHPWLIRENIPLPIILFIDGHSSHLSLHTSQFCKEHGIILVALHPNATHIIQPMDVAVFRTLKSAWKEEVHKWRLENIAKEFKKRHFGPLLETAIKKSVTPRIVSNGFKKCGLFPWDPEAINFNQNPKNEVKAPSKDNQVSTETMTLTNCTNKFQVALSVIEEEIGCEKLNCFRENELCFEWRDCIDIEDSGLFQIWKNIKRRLIENIDQSVEFQGFLPVITESDLSGISLGEMEILASEPIEENIDTLCSTSTKTDINQEKNLSLQPNSESSPIHPKDTEVDTTTKNVEASKLETPVNNLIPSPFKRALVYPEEKTSKRKSRLKEKIPFVVSSKEWQEYYKRKEEKKKELENLKAERLKKRQEKAQKKAEEQEAKNKKRKQKQHDDESDEDIEEEGLGSEQKKTKDINNISTNSYVIVEYEEEYFPGVVLEKRDDGANVKVMMIAGPNTWKWPEKDDILFYLNEEIIDVINPPELKNARGHYYVPEIINIRKKIT